MDSKCSAFMSIMFFLDFLCVSVPLWFVLHCLFADDL
jgi:hypothetical protein